MRRIGYLKPAKTFMIGPVHGRVRKSRITLVESLIPHLHDPVSIRSQVFVEPFFHKFIVSYVFSKDPVRRLWGAITGYRPPKEGDKNQQTTDDTGRRPHFLARMAPFLFPIYTILAVIVLVALDAFKVVNVPLAATCFVVGLTYMFHLFEVGYDMKRGHPDLAAGSMVLSVVLIVLINLQVIVGILDLAVPRADVSYVQFNKRFLEESRRWYTDTRQVARDTFGL